MKYKNYGRTPRTFYDITFKPGDVKEVPGYINCNNFVRIFDDDKPVLDKAEVVKSAEVITKPKKSTKHQNKQTKLVKESYTVDDAIPVENNSDEPTTDDKEKDNG